MKCISIRQPWAWLIVSGFKDVENRTWKIKHRGPLLIHASKKFDREGYGWVQEAFPEINMPKPEEFAKGGIVGRVELTDCVTKSDSPWFFGPCGFVVDNPKAFEAVMPYKGQLGLFDVEEYES